MTNNARRYPGWLLALPLSVHAAALPVTIYADAGYPPYSYEDAGKPAGLYYEIVRTAVSRMPDYKVKIQPVPWKRGMAMLKSGAAFALYPPYMNTKEEPWTWPYSLPLYEEKVVAVCRKELLSKPRRHWPQDFYGLTIGNNAGFVVGGDEFETAVRDGKLRVEEGKDTATNIVKLGLKRIDCYINDRVSIQWTRNQLKAQGRYDEGRLHAELAEATVIAVEHGFLGFTDRDNGKFTYKTDFVKQFDSVVYQMKRTGEIEAIARSYFRNHP
jgi:polar amino acid transport system substrate-binding protein